MIKVYLLCGNKAQIWLIANKIDGKVKEVSHSSFNDWLKLRVVSPSRLKRGDKVHLKPLLKTIEKPVLTAITIVNPILLIEEVAA